jgi:hypothetical protein
MNTTEHSQKHCLARSISWLMLGLTLVAFAGALVLQWLGCGNLFDTSRPEPALAYGLAMIPLNGLAFALLGTLIITYRPDNRFGWLANLYGVAIMWTSFVSSYGLCSIEGRAVLAGGDYAVWLDNVLNNVAFLSLALMPWLFPDGRFLTARWRRVGLVGIALALVFTALRAIWPAPLRVDPYGRIWIDNPLSLPAPDLPWLDAFIAGPNNLIILVFFLGIISLVLRWRRSSGEPRQQIKWLAFFFATAGTLFMAVEVLGAAFYPAIFDGWFYLLVLMPFWLGLPLVMGLAVFKYRLYDIDVVIRKTLLYAVLTGLLALVYFGSVIVLQGLFSRLAGVQQSTLAVVVSTLAIAALFTPLRRRVQDAIDRRFYRRKYDAQQVLAQFAQTARDETDLDALLAELVRVVDETLQPEHVSVWLKKQ